MYTYLSVVSICRAHIDPLVKLLRRRGRQGAAAGHTAPCDGVYNGGGGCGLRYRPVVAGRRDIDGAMNRRDVAGGSGNGYGEADSRTRRRGQLGRQRHHSAPHSTASAAEKSVARACAGRSSKSSSKSPTGRSASSAFGAGAESGDGNRAGDQVEAEEIDGVDEAEWFDVRGTSAKSATANAQAIATATVGAAATTAAADGGRKRGGGRGFRGRGSSRATSVVDLEIEEALAREEEAEGQRAHGHRASTRRADFYQEMADALHLVGLPVRLFVPLFLLKGKKLHPLPNFVLTFGYEVLYTLVRRIACRYFFGGRGSRSLGNGHSLCRSPVTDGWWELVTRMSRSGKGIEGEFRFPMSGYCQRTQEMLTLRS